MFGDILSDAASVLPGSLGLMPLRERVCCSMPEELAPASAAAFHQLSQPRPSASLGDGLHMYEPSGGSAPDIAGQRSAKETTLTRCIMLCFEKAFGEADCWKAKG